VRRAGECIAKRCEQLCARLGHRSALAAQHEPIAIQLHFEAIAEADERIACEPLAALDAFQQKARLERGELHERRDRRVEVPGDVEMRLHAVVLPQITRYAQTTKNPPPGSPEMGSGAVENLLSRENWPERLLRQEGRHHQSFRRLRACRDMGDEYYRRAFGASRRRRRRPRSVQLMAAALRLPGAHGRAGAPGLT
jgi:hypothetical protein